SSALGNGHSDGAPLAPKNGHSDGAPYRVICRVLEPSSGSPEELPGELRGLAQELRQRPGVVALLAGVGERTHLCFSCAEGLDLDAASLLREACARLGGKGGGRPHLAQGSAPPTDPARIEVVLSDLSSNIESHNKG
ncbi:MAG: DHHA1 domain-containing protein, partial [Chloroflexota bacterium]|nr:DHHA1 domain-containing protein [Chloroflexota bacterium]